MFTRVIHPFAHLLRKTTNSLLFAVSLLMTMSTAGAIEVLSVPEDITPPFYARIGFPNLSLGDIVLHDDQYAAIPFYRDPNTVPDSFNLLNFFDPTVRNVREGLLVEGFQIHKQVPGPPIYSNYKSNGIAPVPVWFAPWQELEAAFEGGLYMPELTSMENLLIGNASFFTEVLHPPEAAQVGRITINAHGILNDGTTPFRFHATAGEQQTSQVLIDFKATGVGQGLGASTTAVPEPAGQMLFVAGSIGLCSCFRKRRPKRLSYDVPADNRDVDSSF